MRKEVKTITINKKLVRCVEYAGYYIHLYPKTVTEKAIEFHLFDKKQRITKETLWIPKSALEGNKDGIEYYGLNWLFDKYETREKLEKIGYRV